MKGRIGFLKRSQSARRDDMATGHNPQARARVAADDRNARVCISDSSADQGDRTQVWDDVPPPLAVPHTQ